MARVKASEDRTANILDAAVSLAAKGGFENVRQREVAAHAGVTLRTLYRRFQTKEELLTAALAREADALEAELKRRPPAGREPAARLSDLFSRMTRALVRRPDFAKAVVRAMASGAAGTAAHVLAFNGRTSDLVLSALRGKGATTREPTPGEHEVVFLLLQIWFACLVGWSAELFGTPEVDSQMARAITIVLRGAAP